MTHHPLLSLPSLPLVIAMVVVVCGGWYLLDRQAAQARDTIRKHHLDDIEHALYYTRRQAGVYPPVDQPSWCGTLNDPEHRAVRDSIEQALRAQNPTYANLAKPFPTDPLATSQGIDYFYWKRSPALFELYAILEAQPTGERTTLRCPAQPTLIYDYGLNSLWREPVQ
jgi:hypothetical protein